MSRIPQKIGTMTIRICCFGIVAVAAYNPAWMIISTNHHRSIRQPSSRSRILPPFMAASLRRGEEMWPPTNVENPVQLKDSFPVGYVVPVPPQPEESSSYPKGKRNRIKRILQKAAQFQIQKTSTSIDFTPFFLSIVVLFLGYVTPMDRLFVLIFSAYVTCLYQWAQQPILETNEDDRVVMPSLPPQGHVPFLWTNPLGLTITNSTFYQIWIQIGAVIGFLAPLTCMTWNLLSRSIRKVNYFPPSSMRLCGSPLFLLGCQVFSEAVAKRFLVSYGIITRKEDCR